MIINTNFFPWLENILLQDFKTLKHNESGEP